MKLDNIKKAARRRKYHVRKKVVGTPERPRLSVFRSNRQIYAQVIDDVSGVTLVSANTLNKDVSENLPNCSNKEAAQNIGREIAKRALSVGINCVCFDRSSYKFHKIIRIISLQDKWLRIKIWL